MSDQATRLRRLVQGSGMADDGGGVGLVVPPSVRTGQVSFRPEPARPRTVEPVRPAPVRMARAIAVSSGKGGVGKSNLAVNLCVALAAMRKRVCLIDADLGLANADVLCNVQPRLTLDDVAHGRCRLGEAVLEAPGGFRLVPGASGVTRMADLPLDRQEHLLRKLSILERAMDIIVIDTGAGIHRSVLDFAAAAHTVLVTVTPEPTSITDGYGLIKALTRRTRDVRLEIVVNMCDDAKEGRAVAARIDRVSRTFLNRPVEFAGVVPMDETVREAVRGRVPFALYAPKAPASKAVVVLARHLADPDSSPDAASGGFLARFLRRVGMMSK